MENKHKPVIGITLGDFNGIGPEIILKTLTDHGITKFCTPVIYGSTKIFNKGNQSGSTSQNQYHPLLG